MKKQYRSKAKCGESSFKPKADDVCIDTHLNNPLQNLGLKNTLTDIRNNTPISELPYNRAVNVFDLLRVAEAAGVGRTDLDTLDLNPQCLVHRLHSAGVYGEEVPHEHIDLKKHVRVSSQLTELTGFQFIPESILDKVIKISNPETGIPNWKFLKRYHTVRSRLEQGVMLTMKPGRHTLAADLAAYPAWRLCNLIGDDRGSFVISTKIDQFGKIFLSCRHMIVINQYGKWVGTRDNYLMFHDCIVQRWISSYSASLAQLFDQPNYPPLDTLLKVFDWGDNIINRFGNDGYAAIKIWESLLCGLILASEPDPVVECRQFLDNMEKDLYSSVPGDDHYIENSWVELRTTVLEKLNLHQLYQLHGLYRIWGHPSIDIISGLAKLRQVACTPRLPCATSIQYQLVSWREQFCVGFYNIDHRWPNLTILESMPSNSLLKKCLESGSPLPLNSPQYLMDDWAHIKFLPTFCVPAKFDLNSTTKDSATSLGFEELANRIEEKGTIGSAAERSVIIRFLSRKWTTPEEFLKKIDKEGFDKDERVIGLREKERELSSSGRYFGLLPIEKRIYVVVTEAMIAEELLPYIPDITMTYNLVKLREHIQRATKKLNLPEDKTQTVVTNMDFVKWNSNMREEETAPLFKDIDNLFGFENLVSRTYEMFRESQMYLADGHVIPEVDKKKQKLVEGPTVWSNHLGGVEGLRQKGWTLFTVSLIKRVARLRGLNCTLMGQGDNQVLVTTYSYNPDKSYKDQHQEFLNVLTRCLSSIGPPLKPEETWSSSYLFSYGKYAVWKGAPLSNALKMIIKMARMTNEGLQNLASTLSSMTANCTAATDVDLTPLIAYLVCALESSIAVELSLSRPCYSETAYTTPSQMKNFRIPNQGVSLILPVEKDDRIITPITRYTIDGLLMILLSPSSLGGYPVCHYWSLVMHGFPDQLSLDIQGLKSAFMRTKKPLLKLAISRLLFPPLNHDVNPLMLCQDPYSLNLLHGSTSIDKIKGMVLEYLISDGHEFIQNEHFLNFLDLASKDQQELGNLLYQCNHLHPRVCNALLEATIVGKINQSLSKVTKTGVLVNMMLKFKFSSIEEMYSRIRLVLYDAEELEDNETTTKRRRTFFEMFGSFEQNQLNCLIHTLCVSEGSLAKSHIPDLCSYQHAKRLRDTSWQKSIEGVTVAVPWELLKMCPSVNANCEIDQHPCLDGGYILTHVLGTVDIDYLTGKSGNVRMGPITPYLGKSTKNKVDYEAKKLAENAPPILRNALTLLQLVGWATRRDSKLSELIFRIVESITDAPARHLVPLPDEIAGTFGHRFDDVKTSRMCTSSIIPTGSSYITSNTNHFSPESVNPEFGTDNLHLQFQSIFLFIQHYLSVRHTFLGYPVSDHTIHWHINCQDCIYPVNEELIDLEVDEIPWESFAFLDRQTQNPYLWVPVESLPRQLIPTQDWGTIISIPEHSSYDQVSDLLAQSLACDFMKHHGLTSPAFRSGADSSAYEIPVTIVTKLPFILFIQELIFMLFLRLCWIHATRLEYHERYQSMLPWISGHLNTLRQIPIQWFEPLHRLLDHPRNLRLALDRWPNLCPPIGSPPTKQQISFFFQELFRKEVEDSSFIERFRAWCHPAYRANKLQILQQGLSNHPVSRWALSTLLSGNSDDRIWYFSRFLKDESLLFSDLNVTSVSDLNFLTKDVITPKQHLDALSVRFSMYRFLSMNPNPNFVSGTHHGIAAALAPRIRPSNLEEADSGSSLFDLTPAALVLPRTIACKMLLSVAGKIHPLNDSITVSRVLPNWDMSIINHLFKPYKNPTTAHYKLLSILVYCKSMGIELIRNRQARIFGLADGDGGFCNLIHRVYPEAQIVYNSLYDVRKLNHTGASSIRPSSIFSTESLIKQVVGLSLVEEGLSDLTDENTFNALVRNFPKGDLLLCDAEGEGINSPAKELNLAKQVARLSHLIECPTIIYKTYTKSLGLCFSVVNIWLTYYNSVKVLRSYFSGYGNSEVYLLIREPLETARSLPNIKHHEGGPEITIGCYRSDTGWGDFCESLSVHADYVNIPCGVSLEYTRSVVPRAVFKEWNSEFINFVTRYTGGHKFKFPFSFIRTLNQQLAPVTLARSTPATWVISYFTPAIKTEIYSHFCYCWAISIMLYNDAPAVWSEWVHCLNHLRLLCYQCIDGRWSIWPTMPGDIWPTLSACVVISNLDISESARKNIVSTAGKLRLSDRSSVQEVIERGFCGAHPAWGFSPLGRRQIPQVLPTSSKPNFSVHWRFAPIPDREWIIENPESFWFYSDQPLDNRGSIKDNYYRLQQLANN